MACYRPQDGYRYESGAVSMGFEKAGSTEKLRIPCGNCFGCRMAYAESWSIRLQHESACWETSHFVTLTYEDLPRAGSLDKTELQRFIKRLRKHYDPQRIRYFGVGEYGGETGRPHFHLALFNAPIQIDGYETASVLQDLWPFGSHNIAGFTAGRARYIAGYAVKKIRGRVERKRAYETVELETGEVVERAREFNVMSRRPGIGSLWYERFKGDLERGYVIEAGGKRKRLPRFYSDKLMRDARFAMEAEEKRDAWIIEHAPGDTPKRRFDGELVHLSRYAVHTSKRGL